MYGILLANKQFGVLATIFLFPLYFGYIKVLCFLVHCYLPSLPLKSWLIFEALVPILLFIF